MKSREAFDIRELWKCRAEKVELWKIWGHLFVQWLRLLPYEGVWKVSVSPSVNDRAALRPSHLQQDNEAIRTSLGPGKRSLWNDFCLRRVPLRGSWEQREAQEGWKKLQDFHEGDDREQESKEWELHLEEFRYCRGPEGFEEPAGTNGHFLTGGVDRPWKSQGELEQVVLRKACRPGRTSWRSFQERAARSKEESKCRDK